MIRAHVAGVAALAAGLAALAAAAAACGLDDPLADPFPTVPVVTAADGEAFPSAGAGDGAAGDGGAGDGAGGDRGGGDRDSAGSAADSGGGEDQTGVPDSDVGGPAATADRSVPPNAAPPEYGDLEAAEIGLEVVVTLDAPLDMAMAPGDDMAWVAERAGRVLRVDLDRGVVVETVLDITAETTTDGERGLLGLAVSEDWLYVDYTDLNGHTRVDAFEREGTGLSGRRREILFQEQPYSNHNGGAVRFGPDGLLYVGFGDGGGAGDPLDAGQDPSSWLGAILRIDPTPEAAEPYAIPPGNPYADAGAGGRPEVFLTGVRNPWRFSFDAVTGDLWVADVGQNSYEEVTLLLAANNGGAGANLGWPLREGLHSFAGGRPAGNVDPVWEYELGCSVTGGQVYRGSAVADLAGAYVFGDFCTSRVWAVSVAGGVVSFRDLGVEAPGDDLVSFGQDAAGELYTLSLKGPIARIVPR